VARTDESTFIKFILDSRLIYESNKTYIRKVQWTRPNENPESEWLYLGLADELKKDLAFKILDEHFADDGIYLSHERGDSFQTTITDFKAKVDKYIGTLDFTLWDLNFSKVIQFNKVGILRRGTTTSH